jgi:hypothetical protein
MKTEGTRPGKTEVLSMRIDAKTRFQIEVLARVRGQRVSTVVERAIQEAADNVGWREYWHAEEGIRWIRMVSSQEEFNTAGDADKLEFTRHHWPFFYVTRECFPHSSIREGFIRILWPKIDEFVDIWNKTKANNYFFAGKALQNELIAAGVSAPDWPMKPPKATAGASRGTGPSWDAPKGGDLDDEIPF